MNAQRQAEHTVTITINKGDKRDRDALEMFRQARGWAQCRVTMPNGRVVKAYGLPSRSEPNVYRLTNLRQCSCPDFLHRQDGHGGFRCSHMRAVRWYVDWIKAEQRKQAALEAEEASRRELANQHYQETVASGLVDAF